MYIYIKNKNLCYILYSILQLEMCTLKFRLKTNERIVKIAVICDKFKAMRGERNENLERCENSCVILLTPIAARENLT